ncbi:hypothetical protein E2320_003081 [Naja naja]|nr:hypothetical protein E2320_003081 [Naja naja]
MVVLTRLPALFPMPPPVLQELVTHNNGRKGKMGGLYGKDTGKATTSKGRTDANTLKNPFYSASPANFIYQYGKPFKNNNLVNFLSHNSVMQSCMKNLVFLDAALQIPSLLGSKLRHSFNIAGHRFLFIDVQKKLEFCCVSFFLPLCVEKTMKKMISE